jgi:hypothetical protein
VFGEEDDETLVKLREPADTTAMTDMRDRVASVGEDRLSALVAVYADRAERAENENDDDPPPPPAVPVRARTSVEPSTPLRPLPEVVKELARHAGPVLIAVVKASRAFLASTSVELRTLSRQCPSVLVLPRVPPTYLAVLAFWGLFCSVMTQLLGH